MIGIKESFKYYKSGGNEYIPTFIAEFCRCVDIYFVSLPGYPDTLFVKTSKGTKRVSNGDYIVLYENNELDVMTSEEYGVNYE